MAGYIRAIDQMGTYKPEKGDDATSVAPLLQFFELVHIGDTIQSMVQVYFDKELVSTGALRFNQPLRFANNSHTGSIY